MVHVVAELNGQIFAVEVLSGQLEGMEEVDLYLASCFEGVQGEVEEEAGRKPTGFEREDKSQGVVQTVGY